MATPLYQEQTVKLKQHFLYMYGSEFWYSAPDMEALARPDVDLYASTIETEMPIIWHLAHIVHKEEVHIGHFLERPRRHLLHPELNPLVMDGEGLDTISDLIPDLGMITEWHNQVRAATIAFISSLSEDDFFVVPDGSHNDLSIANWLTITQVHTGVHLGRIDSIVRMQEADKK